MTLISGPVALETPFGVKRISVTSGQQMYDETLARVDSSDVFVATAAVAEWRVRTTVDQKIKKARDKSLPKLDLVENPDILKSVTMSTRAQSGKLYCVGFAAESENLEQLAIAKRQAKGVPLLVANLGPQTFGLDENSLLLVDESGTRQLGWASKDDLSLELVNEIASRISK